MNKPFSWMVAITIGVVATAAQGQSQAFTYQGQLKLQGIPLTELVDVKYTLFDSEFASTAVAGPLSFDGNIFPAIQVTNGLFSTELDFGPGALQLGQWLEIEVRSPHDPSDVNPYITLTPRQHISAAPFALSVPGLETSPAGVEVEGDIHAVGQIAASAYTSNSPFIIKVNPLDMECARFDDANCFMGLGTTAPQARLHIGGVAGVDGLMFPDGSLMTTAAGLGGGGGGFWSAGGANIFNNNGGNVGIGTSAPASKLDISAIGDGAELLRFTTERPWVFRQVYSGSGTALQLKSTVGLKSFEITAAGGANVATFFGSDLAGNLGSKVGIGTTAPLSTLDIAAAGDGAELLRFSTERPWIFRQIRSGPSAGLQLLSTSGLKAFEITASDGSNVATFLADSGTSRVGIGTNSPTNRLDVVGSTGDAIHATHFGSSLTAGVSGTSLTPHGNGIIGRADIGNSAYGVWGQSASGTGGYFTGGNYALVADGRAKVGLLEISGADVAEKFLSSDGHVEPGTVMEIDPENSGQLRVAREAYSSRVAGVVSGAGDIPMGAVLGNLPGYENAPSIALSGRVWVRCDAGKASIAPGDLLTTSDSAGLAMKASDRERSHGTIIGKAMGALAQGECGLVLVLVNLQ